LLGSKLRVAMIGEGLKASSTAEALSASRIKTFLLEHSPSTGKPCGGAIPLYMLDELCFPLNLINRHVTRMEAVMEFCGDKYVQRMTFDSYLYTRLANNNRWEDVKMLLNTIGSLMTCKIVGREMEALKF
ncbi:hypothetical protein CFOL_v3_19474, partial [Cephalotus follicularis]